MNCDTCPKREFVHADLYCRDCQDKPKSESIMYHATLDRDYHQAPINAILDLDIPEDLTDDQKVLFAASKLLTRFHVNIDPIVDDYGLIETVLEGCQT